MNKNRLEAFSDGVIAIIITIMVLELKIPHGAGVGDLAPLFPVLISYVLSFVYIGIYWNNHHHLLHSVKSVNGKVLWANLHLLFWLSLTPFVTAWAGENQFSPVPTACYGIDLFMAAIAFTILTRVLVKNEGPQSVLAKALGRDYKGKISLFFYLLAIALAFIFPMISTLFYFVVAIIWIVPDSRIESRIHS